MFENSKVIWAINFVTTDLETKGIVSKEQRILMMRIAKNDANLDYGVNALRSKVARDKYSAAAAIFARLSVRYYEEPLGDGITWKDWEFACQNALLASGASPSEAEENSKILIEMNKRIEGGNE